MFRINFIFLIISQYLITTTSSLPELIPLKEARQSDTRLRNYANATLNHKTNETIEDDWQEIRPATCSSSDKF